MENNTRIKLRQYLSPKGDRVLEYSVFVDDVFLGTTSRCRDAESLIQRHLHQNNTAPWESHS